MYVDGEHDPARGEARVAVGEQRQGAYTLGVLRVHHAAGAVGAYPPQFVPVVRVMVDEQRDGRVGRDVGEPFERSAARLASTAL